VAESILTAQLPAASISATRQSRGRALVLRLSRNRASVLAVGSAFATATILGTVGADARWVAALGKAVAGGLGPREGVPFASAPTDGWPNVPMAAELVFHALVAGGGERALVTAQLLAVGLAFGTTAAVARRRGASDTGVALAVSLAFLGAIPAIAVTRLQLFSLVLFPLLVALLRAEASAPSRRLFLLVPLFAVWSNLHGAALVGLAVTAAYLLVERLRQDPLRALTAFVASAVALLATPALLSTPAYYAGVLDNEAARRGFGLWAPPSLHSGFDVLLIVAAVTLVALAVRSRPRLWELVAIAGLGLATVQAARSGIWLLLFAAAPAALGLRARARPSIRLGGAIATVLLVALLFGIVRGPVASGAGNDLVREAVARAQGTPILAEDILAEQVVLGGGRMWVGNPLDAFSPSDQRLYLDWLQGRPEGDAAVRRVPRLVLVHRGSDAQRRLATRDDMVAVASDHDAVLYRRLP